MAELPPNLRRGLGRFERIEVDRLCAKCSYNLRGLTTGDRCPECATPAGATVPNEQWISEAPLSFLQPFSKGAMLTGVMIPVQAIATVAMLGVRNSVWIAMLCALTGMIYAIGVRLLTIPRPSSRTTDGTREWSLIRSLSRITQWGWCASSMTFAAAIAILNANASSPSGAIAQILSGLLMLVAIVGLVPLLIYVVRIANWAGDTEFSDRLKLLPLFVPVAAVLLFGAGMIAPRLSGGVVSFLLVPLAGVSIIFLLYGGFTTLSTFWNLSSMGYWVIRNRTESLDSSQRRSARIVQRIEDGMARPPRKKKDDDTPIDLA